MTVPLPPSRSARRRGPRRSDGEPLLRALESSIGLLRYALLVAVLIYLTSGITFVAPQDDAVIYRLGRRLDHVHAPGLLLALPEPFDRVVRVPTRATQEIALDAWAGAVADTPAAAKPGDQQYAHLNAMAAGVSPDRLGPVASKVRALHPVRDGYTLTGDANIVQGRMTLRYRIREPLAWLDAMPESPALLESLVYRRFTHLLAARGVDPVLASGREALLNEARRRLQQDCDRLGLGLEIERVELGEIGPPRAVLPAFEEVISAQVEARTAIEQARTYAATLLPKAQAEAYRLRSDADAARATLVARADGEARSFQSLLAEYERAPDLVTRRLLAETRARIWPRLHAKTVLPEGSGPLRLYLPSSK